MNYKILHVLPGTTVLIHSLKYNHHNITQFVKHEVKNLQLHVFLKYNVHLIQTFHSRLFPMIADILERLAMKRSCKFVLTTLVSLQQPEFIVELPVRKRKKEN